MVGPVGYQLNISSIDSGGALEEAIGAQESWHIDAGDDSMTYTLVTMLLWLPLSLYSYYFICLSNQSSCTR